MKKCILSPQFTIICFTTIIYYILENLKFEMVFVVYNVTPWYIMDVMNNTSNNSFFFFLNITSIEVGKV